MLATIEAGLLLEVVWASLLSGVVVSILFSLVVLFSGRSAEARRAGAGNAAMAYAAIAVISMAAFAAIVGYGVHIMLSKT